MGGDADIKTEFTAIVKKSKAEELRVCLSGLDNIFWVTLRIFYFNAATGEMWPTKKGVTMNLKNWVRFKKAIDDLDKELKRRGFVEYQAGDELFVKKARKG